VRDKTVWGRKKARRGGNQDATLAKPGQNAWAALPKLAGIAREEGALGAGPSLENRFFADLPQVQGAGIAKGGRIGRQHKRERSSPGPRLRKGSGKKEPQISDSEEVTVRHSRTPCLCKKKRDPRKKALGGECQKGNRTGFNESSQEGERSFQKRAEGGSSMGRQRESS